MIGAPYAPILPSFRRAWNTLLLCLLSTVASAQQDGPATRGTRFWTGFIQNGFGANSLKVHVLSTVPTSGTVSMPGTGWSNSFAVAANAVSVIDVPLTAEHLSSGVVEPKGILITTQDSVDVHIGSFQNPPPPPLG